MAIISWDARLETKHTKIDEQHKALIQAFNDLHVAMKQGKGKDEVGRTLTFLKDYTVTHFKTEEELMAKSTYPHAQRHHDRHREFVGKATDLVNEFNSGKAMITLTVMNFIEGWLVEHIGAGSIGQAIARRVSSGKVVLLADLRRENADAAAKVLSDAGFDVKTEIVDVSSRESVHALVQAATKLGEVTGVIHAAGVSPSQAAPATILKVDLYGTALVLEELGNVIAHGGAGVVIASQSGHRLGL